MAEVTVKVCDVCQDRGRTARTYSITQGDRSRTLDLCDVHSRGIEVHLTPAPTRKASSTTTGGRRKREDSRRTMEVVDVATIEASKK